VMDGAAAAPPLVRKRQRRPRYVRTYEWPRHTVQRLVAAPAGLTQLRAQQEVPQAENGLQAVFTVAIQG